MKKIVCIFLAVSLLACVAGCSGKTGKSQESVVKKTNEQLEGYTITQTSVKKADKYTEGGVSVEVCGFNYNDVDTALCLHIKNGADRPLRIVTANLSINGMMCTDSLFLEIPATSEKDGFLKISNEWFGRMQISTIADMEFVVKVFDENNNEIMQSPVLRVETDAPFFHQQDYDDSGVEIYNQNGIKLSARSLQKSALSEDMELVFYAENNTDHAISVMSYDVSVNGVAIEPLFVMSVGAGKKAVDTMVFYKKDLDALSISQMETVTAKFKAFNENLETAFETDSILVPIA